MARRPPRLPVRIEPSLDESFSSYLDRLAWRLGVPLTALLESAGLTEVIQTRFRQYGVTLDRASRDAFAHTAWLDPETVDGLLLSRYDGIALDLAALSTRPAFLRGLPKRRWVYTRGSLFCPACLEEREGAWKLSWRFPWSYACVEHALLLVDRCPRCGLFPESTGGVRPSLSGSIRTPGVCSNRIKVAASDRVVTCEARLARARTKSLSSWPDLLSVQASISANLVDSTARSILGVPRSALEYFDGLQSLCSFLLAFAEPQDLGRAPASVRAAFCGWFHNRELRFHDPGASDIRRQSRHHFGPPRQSALLAGVLPLAASVLEAGSSEECGAELARIARRSLDSGVTRQILANCFLHTPWLLAACGVGRTERRRWSDEAILRSIQEWTERHGEPPAADRWPPASSGNPSSRTIIRRFGSWSAGIDAALSLMNRVSRASERET